MIRNTPKPPGYTAATNVQNSGAFSPQRNLKSAIEQVAALVVNGKLAIAKSAVNEPFMRIGFTNSSSTQASTLNHSQLATAVDFVAAQRGTLQAHDAGVDLIEATDLFAAYFISKTDERVQNGPIASAQLTVLVGLFQNIQKNAPSEDTRRAAGALLKILLAQQPRQQASQQAFAMPAAALQKNAAKKRNISELTDAQGKVAPQAPKPKRQKAVRGERVAAGGAGQKNRLAAQPGAQRAGAASRGGPTFNFDEHLNAFAGQSQQIYPKPSDNLSLSDPAHVDLLPYTNATTSSKSAPIERDLKRYLGLPDRARYRELSPQTSGKTYFITPTLKRGSYGKVRLSLGTDGQICAIKQVRTKHSKPKSNRSGTGKPIPLTTSDASISQEIAVANIVDPFLAPSSRIIVNGDNYLVMPFVIGDGLEVANRLPSAVRQCVCRVMLQDVAIMLADNMHAKNILHGDMKPGNTLVHKESGTTHIADFGSAKFLAAGSSVDARLGISGTYTAPEKCTKMPYGLKSDVFEFGAGALTLILGYAGQTIRNPFVWKADKNGHVDLAAMRGVHQRFEAWLSTRLGPDRLLDKTKMTNPTSEFDPIFHRALTIDQHVTQYIAGRMLRTMPEQRAASSEVKQFFLSIHSARPDQTQVGREVLQALPYDLDVERDIIALRRVLDYRMKQSPELALENQANPANQSQL